MFKCRKSIFLLAFLFVILSAAAMALNNDGVDREAVKQATELNRPTFQNVGTQTQQGSAEQAIIQAKLDEQAQYEAKLAETLALEAEAAQKASSDEPIRHGLKPEMTKNQLKGDQKIATMTGHPKVLRDAGTILLSEDFETSTFPPVGWDTVNTDPGFGWFLGTFSGGGTQCALVTWHAPGYQQDEWLLTPSLDVSTASAADLKVEFWMLKGYDYPHDFKAYVSTDNGVNWTEVFDSYSVPYPAFEWYHVSVPIGSYAGGPNIMIGFQYYGVDADLFGIDDISVNDDAFVEPTGRCCSGDVNTPTCEDGVTQAYCSGIGGNWVENLNCTDNPCPIPGGNDDCSNAIAIPGPFPVQVDGTTIGATIDCPGDPDIGDWDAVWYSFELPYASNNVVIDYCGTMTTPPSVSATLFTACSCDAGVRIYYDAGYYYDCSGVSVPHIEWNGVPGPGVIYYAVWTGGAKASLRSQQDFVFTVDVAEPPPAPENDNCSNATAIGDVTGLAFSTLTATPDNTGYTTGPNVWYCYTASCDGQATVSLCGSSYDTKVAAYDGCSCTLGAALATNDDFCSTQSQIVFNVVKDNTYLIEVGGYSAGAGDGVLTVSCAEVGPGNPGDNCSDPLKVDIPSLPYTDIGQTTCGRVNDYSATCMGYYDGGEDIIYEVTVSSAVDVDITLDPKGSTWTGVAIMDACPSGTANCIDQSTSSSGSPHGMTCVHLEPGTYYIMVDTWPSPTCITEFDLTISAASGCNPPDNDNCASATEISNVTDLAFSTENATFDGPGGCQTSANVWYVYTPPCDGSTEVTVSLCGSAYDTKLAVYDGAGCDSPQLACNDDACGTQSEIVFQAMGGNSYLIEVGGYSTRTGTGILNVNCTAPCTVECPAGASSEGEACGDDTNGGCNSAVPAFTPVACGETICGNAWMDGGSRDTDWYELMLDDYTRVTIKVVGELPIIAGFLETSDPGNITCENATGYIAPYQLADKCDTATVTADLAPGRWWIFVGGSDFYDYSCATGPYDYVMSLSCETIEPTYCAASGGCDEYISRVAIAEIDNSSDCSGYADYTGMTANMELGTGYAITVENGNGYSADICGVWVDWNHDLDFDDAGEMVTLDVATGYGPYTGTVTPPADALQGNTRMRVRINYSSAGVIPPCGNTTYGEVEDYTVNVGVPITYVVRPDTLRVVYKFGVNPVVCNLYMGNAMLPSGMVGDMENVALSIAGCPVSVGTTDIITGGYAGIVGDVLHVPFDGGNYITCQETAQGGLIWDNVDSFFDITYEIAGNPGQVSGQVVVRGHIAGDLNLDEQVDVADLVYMVEFMFAGGSAPLVIQTGDVNGSGGNPDIGDLVSMVEFMFSSGVNLTHP